MSPVNVRLVVKPVPVGGLAKYGQATRDREIEKMWRRRVRENEVKRAQAKGLQVPLEALGMGPLWPET
jgi:hypothetical protein